jgi:BirA family biotin operon repressor/biotin-[acetyl-CoA-carboxylase] ligase
VTGPGEAQERRALVLARLRAASGAVSGQMLAEVLGVSRVAVRKHVAALRTLGYGIGARRGEGYTLLAVPDAPLPSEVAPLLRSAFYARLVGGGSTASTNDDARALARAGAGEGTCVLASAQTGGRGRLGRDWASPRGGVYASVVLRPAVETPASVVLPLVVGLGVARGIAGLGVDAKLKWPNDVLDGEGRKVAGVLLEGLTEAWRVAWIVAGVGVNVRRTIRVEGAVGLDELTGGRVPLAKAAAAVLDGVADAYRAWQRGGFGPLREEYDRRAWLNGRDVTVSDAAGLTLVAGRAEGIDEQGRLVVLCEGKRVPVVAGDVTLRPVPTA